MPYSYQDHQISCLHGGLQYHRQKRAAPIIRITAVPQFQFTPSTADVALLLVLCVISADKWVLKLTVNPYKKEDWWPSRKLGLGGWQANAGVVPCINWTGRRLLAWPSHRKAHASAWTNLSCSSECVWNGRCLGSDFVARYLLGSQSFLGQLRGAPRCCWRDAPYDADVNGDGHTLIVTPWKLKRLYQHLYRFSLPGANW